MKQICVSEQKASRCVLFECFPLFRKRRRRRCLESNYCDLERQSVRITAKHTEVAVKLEWSERGERHRRYSREDSGERVGRRANQFIRRSAIACAKLKRRHIGWNCSSTRRSSHRKSFSHCVRNATNSLRSLSPS